MDGGQEVKETRGTTSGTDNTGRDTGVSAGPGGTGQGESQLGGGKILRERGKSSRLARGV